MAPPPPASQRPCRFGSRCNKANCRFYHADRATTASNANDGIPSACAVDSAAHPATTGTATGPTSSLPAPSSTNEPGLPTATGKKAEAAIPPSTKPKKPKKKKKNKSAASGPPAAGTASSTEDEESHATTSTGSAAASKPPKKKCWFGSNCRNKKCKFYHQPAPPTTNDDEKKNDPAADIPWVTDVEQEVVTAAQAKDEERREQEEIDRLLMEQERQRRESLMSAAAPPLEPKQKVVSKDEEQRREEEELDQLLMEQERQRQEGIAQLEKEKAAASTTSRKKMTQPPVASAGREPPAPKHPPAQSRPAAKPKQAPVQHNPAPKKAPPQSRHAPKHAPTEKRPIPKKTDNRPKMAETAPSVASVSPTSAMEWTCRSCTFVNPESASNCQICLASPLETNKDDASADGWTCPACTYCNHNVDSTVCEMCDMARPVDDEKGQVDDKKPALPSEVQADLDRYRKERNAAKKERKRLERLDKQPQQPPPTEETAAKGTGKATQQAADEAVLAGDGKGSKTPETVHGDDVFHPSVETEEERAEKDAELARYRKERNAAKKERRRLEREARTLQQQGEEMQAQANLKGDDVSVDPSLNVSNEENVDSTNNETIKEDDEEQKRLFREKFREDKARAVEKKKEQQKKRQEKQTEELARETKTREEFWEAEIAREAKAVEVISLLCTAEFCRVEGFDRVVVARNTAAQAKLAEESRKAFRELFEDTLHSQVVVRGMKQRDQNGKTGTIQYFKNGKFYVGLPTKGKNLHYQMFPPGNLEALPRQTVRKSKKKMVEADPGHLIFIAPLYKDRPLMFELQKSFVSAAIGSQDVDSYVAGLMMKRDVEQQLKKEEEEFFRQREEEDHRRRAEQRRKENEEWEQQKEEFARKKAEYQEWKREQKKAQRRSFGSGHGSGHHGPRCDCPACVLASLFEAEFRSGRGGGIPFFFAFGGGRSGRFSFDEDDFFGMFDDDYDDDEYDRRYEEMHREEMERKNQEYAEIMGVDVDAEPTEIRRSYHRLSRKYHPDKYRAENHEDGMTKEEAAEHFKSVNNAYDHLMSRFDDDYDDVDE